MNILGYEITQNEYRLLAYNDIDKNILRKLKTKQYDLRHWLSQNKQRKYLAFLETQGEAYIKGRRGYAGFGGKTAWIHPALAVRLLLTYGIELKDILNGDMLDFVNLWVADRIKFLNIDYSNGEAVACMIKGFCVGQLHIFLPRYKQHKALSIVKKLNTHEMLVLATACEFFRDSEIAIKYLDIVK